MWVGARRAPRMGVCVFSFSRSPFFSRFCFSLENRSQSALAMPLAKSFASLSIAIVFLFAQSLTARMLGRARAGQRHHGISAYGIRRAVHAGIHTVHHAFANIGAGSRLRESNFTGLLHRVDPFLCTVLASRRVRCCGTWVLESQVLIALQNVSVICAVRMSAFSNRKLTVSIDQAVKPLEST